MRFYKQFIILNRIISNGINIRQGHFSFYDIIKKRKIQLTTAATGCHLYNCLYKWVINFFYTIGKNIIGRRIIIQLFWITMPCYYDQAIGKWKIRYLPEGGKQRSKNLIRMLFAIFSY